MATVRLIKSTVENFHSDDKFESDCSKGQPFLIFQGIEYSKSAQVPIVMISFAVSESDGSTSKLVLTFLGNTHSRSLTALVSRIYVDIELKSFTDDAIDERVESDIIELQFKTEK